MAASISAAGALAGVSPLTNAAPATPSADSVTLPDTPAGQQLHWVLDVLNGVTAAPDANDVEQRFAKLFLDQLPVAQIQEVLRQLSAQLAPVDVVQIVGIPTPRSLDVIVNAKGDQAFVISISVEDDPAHKINSLLFQPYTQEPPATPTLTDWSELEQLFAAAGPVYAIHAAEISGSEPVTIYDAHPGTMLAVGSAFKFYVLGALATKIDAGELAWDQTVPVTETVKSFPSGVTQNESIGKRLSIDELSRRMISISDNTATDMLIDTVSREACEDALDTQGNSDPARTIPFLKTREMFTLKLSDDRTLLQRYINAGVEARRAILAELEGAPLPPISTAVAWTTPIAFDTVEWFATAPDLGRAISWLWNQAEKPALAPVRDILTINPGVPYDDTVWTSVAFKGGSEVGVVAFSWLLERNDGRRFTFSCGVNNPAQEVPVEQLALAAAGAFGLLAAIE